MNVPMFEAKKKLIALVAEVERGVEVTIMLRGVAVAKPVPVAPTFYREKARRAADGLRNASCGTTLGGIAIKDLVNAGRW